MGSPQWSGPRVTAARKLVEGWIREADLKGEPLECTKCGLPMHIGDPFDVDHLIAIREGGAMWDPSNWGPAHPKCNRADGARMSSTARKNKNLRAW